MLTKCCEELYFELKLHLMKFCVGRSYEASKLGHNKEFVDLPASLGTNLFRNT